MPASAFSSLEGVHDVVAEGDRLRVSVIGGLDRVVKAAAAYEVDLVSHEQSLEDIFLAFYGGKEDERVG